MEIESPHNQTRMIKQSLVKQIENLCRDAWVIGRVDIKELTFTKRDAQMLDEEVLGSYSSRPTSKIIFYVNPVTGSTIKINRVPGFKEN